MGDIIDLPEEATPIDFAYKVHSIIGNQAIGAKANGKIVPLDYKIKNGSLKLFQKEWPASTKLFLY